MKTTKVYQVIEGLNKTEIKDFKRFLQSPYFNTSKAMWELGELLFDITSRNEDMPKESVWSALGETRAYDDTRFRKYCSDLMKLVERFLAQYEFDKNPLRNAAYLLKVVSGRRIENLYNSSMRTARRLTNNQEFKGTDYLFDMYQIEHYHQVILEADNRTQKLNVEVIIENLDKFYITQKLMSYMTAMSQKRIVDLDYDLLFIEEILQHVEKNPYPDTPQIRILYLIAKLYQINDYTQFHELKRLLIEHINLFPPSEANKIFRSALNFLIGWLNEGKPGVLQELFDLYNYALNQEFFFLQEGLNPWIFKSIVIVALRLAEYDWCENFIKNYAHHLESDTRENAVLFNSARLQWYQKNHEEVISLLNKVEFEDFSYNLSSKAMLLATYYEIDEEDALYSFLDSFKAFLRRNTAKLPQKRRENYLNLISYTKQLSKLSRRDKEKLNALKVEVQEKANLGDKRWLLEKIDEKLVR
jgi:hypothetical protein